MPKYKGIHVNVPFDRENLQRISNNIEEALDLSVIDIFNDVRSNASSIFDGGGGQIIQDFRYSLTKKSGSKFNAALGWDNDYGEFLEFKPKKTEWEIAPKGISVKGKKLKFLRFYSKRDKKIVYRRVVYRKWTEKSLRPHYGPALRRVKPKMLKRIGVAVVGK